MCAYGVLKPRTNDGEKKYGVVHNVPICGSYQFAYVGLVLVDDLCIVVYPKYLPEVEARDPGDVAQKAMQQVFRVLRKCGGSYSRIATMTEEGMNANDRLALMPRLLEAYDEYGVYENYVKSLVNNGNGDISWEHTIITNLPLLSNGRPIYVEYKTVENERDAADFVMRLHRAVLTECLRFMQDSGLATLLALDEVWLIDAIVEDFGDVDFITYR